MNTKPTKPSKYLCIHGHFYQPPRENPWLEIIEYQASARPYHDWNERVSRESYGPNARARILGEGGRILKMVNNYEYLNFDFGPTLLSWLEQAHPWIYSQILAADQKSLARNNGHGNALAQVYNHIIMPLASSRDKLTQIRWGLADFKHRFGRTAKGMWLAETAVDMETLNLMAMEGVKFTILSPTQAQAVRPLTDTTGSWQDVSGGRIDPSRPYRVLLDKNGHRVIDIFFYDGPLSRAIAYEKILSSGADLLARINNVFNGYQDGPRLVTIATDGESYGHHFKFGEMALSWLFDHIKQDPEIQLTNLSWFLERFPPEKEVKIVENSAWSCPHGVDRWRADCGCSVGQNPEWNQAWRKPLREGLNWLEAELTGIFEKHAVRLIKNHWEARDQYITVILNSSKEIRKNFIARYAQRLLNENEMITVFQLLESQRMSLYMFTSCGWFFDDIAGIEAAQVLMYASRAIELIRSLSEKDLEKGLMDFLVQAKSNDPSYGHGGKVYETLVKPSHIDPTRAIANYALALLMDNTRRNVCLFSKWIHTMEQRNIEIQGAHATIGRVKVIEQRTGYETTRMYLAVRKEGNDLYAFVSDDQIVDLDYIAHEIQGALPESSREKLLTIYAQYLSNVQTLTLKNLIPDVRLCIFNKLTGAVENRLNDSIRNQDTLIQEFINIIQETGDPAPPCLDYIFRRYFIEKLTGLFALDQDERSSNWEDLLRLALFFRTVRFTGSQKKQDAPSALENILREPNLKHEASAFLRFQMDALINSKNSVYLKKMIHFINVIQKSDIKWDPWDCQVFFHDHYQDMQFINALHPDTLSLFEELGRILGFIIGEE
jgi:alpha-amylase/alpha-mannosidase (GH57 family)